MLDAVMQELAREGMTRLKNITLVSVIGVPELSPYLKSEINAKHDGDVGNFIFRSTTPR